MIGFAQGLILQSGRVQLTRLAKMTSVLPVNREVDPRQQAEGGRADGE